jgi:iron complex transport system substrate-binding protein
VVRLEAPAKRIVSLAPHLTELLFEAGAGARIVGADVHSDHPPSARRIERVGDAHGIDMERVLRLRPDLVVAWSSGNARKALARLRALSIPVFESEPRRLVDIARTVERLGALAGTAPQAHAGAAHFRERLAALAARHAGKRPLRVFYEIWHRPLMTIGNRHLIVDALATCGAHSAFADVAAVTAAPAREAVLLADPDAIVVASHDAGALDAWRQWRHLRAVREEALIRIDPEPMHRPTSRMIDAVAGLCGRLDELRARSGDLLFSRRGRW